MARSSVEETRRSLRVAAAVGISEKSPASSAANDARCMDLGGDWQLQHGRVSILAVFPGFSTSIFFEDGEKRKGQSKVLAKEATRAENGAVMITKKGIQAAHSSLSGDRVSTESLNQTAAKGRTETNQSHDVLHA
ncbi:hypothetical protein SEVIR_2G293950v4 [Setaria viridis]